MKDALEKADVYPYVLEACEKVANDLGLCGSFRRVLRFPRQLA